jgi:peptide deformylase
MVLRKIVSVPEPVLRRKAHKVTDFNKDFQTLVNDMVETLRDAPGVGLAAPQIGISMRLFVMEYGDEEDENIPKKLYVFANPEIIQASEEKVIGTEACLSVPDLAGNVERHTWLVVKGQNKQGKVVKYRFDGWLARIFQHEYDHLDGILFTDKAVKVWQARPEETEEIRD